MSDFCLRACARQTGIVVRSWDGEAESSRSGSEGPKAAD